MTPPIIALLIYCRAGFEGECAAETQQYAVDRGLNGYCKAKPDSGYVLFQLQPSETAEIAHTLSWRDFVFARQVLAIWRVLDSLPVTDRVSPLLAELTGMQFADMLCETADTNEAKTLSVFLRKFTPTLHKALDKAGVLAQSDGAPRLHLFFHSSASVMLGLSYPDVASPWPMGIPRLRFPTGAPSRSTLKLEEALLYFMHEGQRAKWLRGGMTAVDLGAAPGGWTWQLVQRGLRVIAVDNGAMDATLMASGLVEHRREDGFRFRPQRPLDWLVCDMVEQPIRIAQLVADWFVRGDCRLAIFNLKLPMKKRYQEVQRCQDLIVQALTDAGIEFELAFKQLYHDREEVTGFLRRVH